MIPIIGYNYGAGEYKRVKELFITIVKAEAIVGAVVLSVIIPMFSFYNQVVQ